MSFMITMADNVMTGFNKFNQYSLSLQLLRLCLTDFGIFVVYLATNFLCLTVLSGYKSILLHELFAKLHDANITQPRFLSISIGYRCVAESTTRLPSSVIKPSNCNNLSYLNCLLSPCSLVMRSSTGSLPHTYLYMVGQLK